MDVFNKCFESAKRTDPLHAAGVYTYYRVISSAQDPVVTHLGRELIMLGSNNYLGLTNHREVKDAAAMALAIYGTGCAGSRLLNGTLDVHIDVTGFVTTTHNQVHFIVCEDGGHNNVNMSRLAMSYESFTLTAPGQSVDIQRTATLSATWTGPINIIVFVIGFVLASLCDFVFYVCFFFFFIFFG